MTTIPHHEFRNQSSQILERVKNGETIDVTNKWRSGRHLDPACSLSVRAAPAVRKRASRGI